MKVNPYSNACIPKQRINIEEIETHAKKIGASTAPIFVWTVSDRFIIFFRSSDSLVHQFERQTHNSYKFLVENDRAERRMRCIGERQPHLRNHNIRIQPDEAVQQVRGSPLLFLQDLR